MIFLRFFVYLALIAGVSSLLLFAFTRDRRYLRFAWQLGKFSVWFLVVFSALVMVGRIILFRG